MDGVAELLRQMSALRRENAELRQKLRRAKASRDHWRIEAWYWKRGMLGKFTHGTPRFIQDDIERRARCHESAAS